ncbi:hypothetical protein SF06_02660 [Pseudomonas flexibilis]|uniref:Outer membrane protein beta-barrel domain-containing protein n=1 Tax=Pseudomonas flexibilis TaxID=706570 RepID=A0A1N6N754_9PSED|nr:outer membrane beta-barrel protein [Pseudomonas flexibilis]KHL70856.1 hypothetical protein SF06_02660 [Pseudomonas flexibilis]SIP87900.1 Outer membrane protein beta-barrel domain-containing protein [Pseudomonas flexibilis]
MGRQVAVLGLAGVIALCSGVAQAAAGDKMFSIGGSLYWIDVDATHVTTMDFTGGSIVGTAAFSDNVAVRGSIYGAAWDVDDELEVTGYDTQLLIGANLKGEGFKYYVALGVFDERIGLAGDDVDDKERFRGAQLGVGFGYNWPQVALDYTLNVRSADDYADFVEESGMMQVAGARRSEVTATATSLALSLRF